MVIYILYIYDYFLFARKHWICHPPPVLHPLQAPPRRFSQILSKWRNSYAQWLFFLRETCGKSISTIQITPITMIDHHFLLVDFGFDQVIIIHKMWLYSTLEKSQNLYRWKSSIFTNVHLKHSALITKMELGKLPDQSMDWLKGKA